MERSPRAVVTIQSRFENIELVQVVMEECLVDCGCKAELRHWIELAMREAVANAIKHGNQMRPETFVRVSLGLQDGDFWLRIQDEGQGFEPQRVEDPLAPENMLRPGGRGLLFIQKFMDRCEYQHEPGKGSMLTLWKRVIEEDEA